MGDLWEAGVKSFKAHIRKIGGLFKYTFEEFSTLLAGAQGKAYSTKLELKFETSFCILDKN